MPEVLHDGIGPGHADDPVAGSFVGVAHRRQGRALAGTGLAGDHGKSVGLHSPAKGGVPIPGDLRVMSQHRSNFPVA